MLGNILVISHIPKSKFDVFDIRKNFSLDIHNMRKIHLIFFQFWGAFILLHYFQNMIEWACLTQGYIPISY